MGTAIPAGAYQMPRIGLGTLGNEGEDARNLVEAALAEGYRHIDTAEYYRNEAAVGEAIARSSVPRHEIWLTTKILHPKAPKPRDIRTAFGASLRRLGLDYVDALLIHWPNRAFDLEEALGTYTSFLREGSTRVIGVSNFPSALLRQAVSIAPEVAIDQIEYHVHIAQPAVLEAVRENGLILTAHTPLARGRLLDDPVLEEIAADRGWTVAQVALRWLIQQDSVVAIPGGDPDHIKHLSENLAVIDLDLSPAEMERIDGLASGLRLVDGPHAPAWD